METDYFAFWFRKALLEYTQKNGDVFLRELNAIEKEKKTSIYDIAAYCDGLIEPSVDFVYKVQKILNDHPENLSDPILVAQFDGNNKITHKKWKKAMQHAQQFDSELSDDELFQPLIKNEQKN